MSSALQLAVALSLIPAAAPTQVLHVGTTPVAEGRARAWSHSAAGAELTRQLRARVADALPAGWRLGAVQLHPGERGRALERNAGALVAFLPHPPTAGRNLVELRFAGDDGDATPLVAWAQLQPSGGMVRSEPVLRRGQEVMVVVRSGNVTVQAKGITQQAAGIGEQVVVLPHAGTHTLQATVRDPATVEVVL